MAQSSDPSRCSMECLVRQLVGTHRNLLKLENHRLVPMMKVQLTLGWFRTHFLVTQWVTCINYQLIQDWTAINEYLLLGTQHSAHHVVRFTAYLESKWFFNPQRWRIARCSDRKVFVIAVCVCVCHPCHFAFRWRVPQPNQQDHIFAKHSDPIGTRQKFRSHEILQIWNDKKSILPHDLISLLSRKSSLKCTKSTCCSASSESKSAKSKKFSSQNDHFEDLFLAIFMCQRLHNLIFWESSKDVSSNIILSQFAITWIAPIFAISHAKCGFHGA